MQEVGAVTIGQIRDGERLEKALLELDGLQRENGEAAAQGDTARKKWESVRKIMETDNLIEVARMLAIAALERKESRGGHFRFDYPEVDTENWTCNIVLKAENGRIISRREAVPGEEAANPPPGVPETAAMPGD